MKDNFKSIMAKTQKLTAEELRQNSEKSYGEMIARENDLLAAFENNKLKSKKLIAEAKYIKKKREENGKPKAKN